MCQLFPSIDSRQKDFPGPLPEFPVLPLHAFHYLHARQDKEARYLDIAHVEGMIAVGPLYLLKHDPRDELQLLGAALVPWTG